MITDTEESARWLVVSSTVNGTIAICCLQTKEVVLSLSQRQTSKNVEKEREIT